MPAANLVKKKVLVMGAGVGGCAAALKLAEAGYEVILLERNKKVLAATSNATPCRLGLGFHYMDLETALKYLEATIDFVVAHPGYRVGEDLPDEHPLRHVRYFITKDSQFPPEMIMQGYEQLKQAYAKIVEQAPHKQVFGPPENFFRILDRTEYEHQANSDKIALGIETQEHLLNWPSYQNHLIEQLYAHPHIKIYTEQEVTDIKYANEKLGYEITAKTSLNQFSTYSSDLLVNATWENIEYLNSKLNFPMTKDARTIRLKVMIEVELPEDLENVHHMFFCFGPHCSLSNLGKRRGFLTYEPVTNIGQTTALKVPAEFEKFTSGQATEIEKQEYATKILAGACTYIAGLAQAKYKDIRFGYVITSGTNININSADSNIHARRESGVEKPAVNLINNGSRKLLYMDKNAQEVLEAVNEQVQALELLNAFLGDYTRSDLKKFAQHQFFSADITDENAFEVIKKTVGNKAQLNAYLLKFFSKQATKLTKDTKSESYQKDADNPPQALPQTMCY